MPNNKYKALIAFNLLLLTLIFGQLIKDTETLKGRFSMSSSHVLGRTNTYYASPTGTGTGLVKRNPSTLQNLLNSSHIKNGDSIILEPGTYTSSTPYKVKHDLTIEGAHGIGYTGTAVIDCNSNNICLEIDSNKELRMNHVDLINYNIGVYALIGAKLDVSKSKFDTSHGTNVIGILGDNQSEISLDQVLIQNGKSVQSKGMLLYEESLANIQDSQFNNLHKAIVAESPDQISIDSSNFINSDYAIHTEDSGEIEISNSSFDNLNQGVQLEGGGDKNFQNNNFQNTNGIAILLVGANPVSIESNDFDTNGVDIQIESEFTDSSGQNQISKVEVKNNLFTNTNQSIVVFTNQTGSNANSSIHNNEFLTNNDAIYIYGPDETYIHKNHFDGNTSNIKLQGSNNLVENNFMENSLVAISSFFSEATVIYNTIVNNTDWGLYLDSDNSRFINNIIDTCGHSGFYIYNSTSEIGYNNVNNCLNNFNGTYTDIGGNTIQNPGFASPGIYELGPSSAMIDAGSILFTSEDFTGKIRNNPDIGAYEY